MREHGITPLLGPALVAYLVADVAAVGGGLGPWGKAIAALAVGVSLAQSWAARHRDRTGAERVGWLGLGAGLMLVPAVGGAHGLSLTVELAAIAGQSVCAAALLDLAVNVPDRVPGLSRGRVRLLPPAAITAAGLLAGFAVLSPAPLLRAGVVLPVLCERAAVHALLGAMLAALWLRHRRPALGSDPGALAANTWALLGLWPSALLLAGLSWLGLPGVAAAGTGLAAVPPVVQGGAWSLLALSLTLSHMRLVDPRERLRVGRASRAGVAGLLTVAGVTLGVHWLAPRLPPEASSPRLWVLPVLVAGQLLWRAVAPRVHRLLAPGGAALLDAMSDAASQLDRARHYEDFARTVLGALRRASGDPGAQPRLYAFDPQRDAVIDAAGQVQLGEAPISPVLLEYIRLAPGEVVLRAPLQAQEVRQPGLRALVEVLRELDALCVVPLVDDGELEGVMVVPRGHRRSTLALEELSALRHFSEVVAAHLASLAAEARAQQRAGEALLRADRNQERIEQLQDEVARLRADARVLRAGRAADRARIAPVAYGPAMRGLLARLQSIASTDAPVLLVAEGGTPVDALAYQVHLHSGRAEQAFVVADCGALRPEEAGEALFGGAAAGRPGLLRLAAEGTLVLLDVAALPLAVQAQLAESMASRRACGGAGGADSYEVTARLVASARCGLDALCATGAFDGELGARLLSAKLAVPPLRARAEDMESLIMMALDRAARIQGRPAVGIDPKARQVLLGHGWPGNQRELQSVIDRAVANCDGQRVTAVDLPPLGAASVVGGADAVAGDPLAGTLESVERLALQRALERAGGNKSEAARLLGLKRTTFLDKIRRHGLEDAVRPSTPAN